jgi:hypothetical protein
VSAIVLLLRRLTLSNTTLGMLVATINSSIVIISLPAIFRGIGLDPCGRATSATWLEAKAARYAASLAELEPPSRATATEGGRS